MSRPGDESVVYNHREAERYGRRRVCYELGHDIPNPIETSLTRGGVQWGGRPGEPGAACDSLKCERCDGVITVTYPEIGRPA